MSTLWPRFALGAILILAGAAPLAAMGSDPPPDDGQATACKLADKSKCPGATDAGKKAKQAPCKLADKSKCPKQSFRQRYLDAVALIDAKQYDQALDAMRELDDGTSADVITEIGFINRKLGNMAEAQMYYEAALHMVPNHRGALEYYGEWYVMMGNVDKARSNLSTIAALYGTDSKEYLALAKMIAEAPAQQKS